MRALGKSAVFALLCVLFTHSATASTLFKDPEFKIKVVRNVQFGNGEVRQPSLAKRPLLADVYQPDSVDPSWKRPVMIAIHGGGFLLLDRTAGAALTHLAAPWADGVTAVADDAATPTGVLVRPDGVVAWATDVDAGTGLVEALRRWAGER